MSLSPQPLPFVAHHGLHLVPPSKNTPSVNRSNAIYRIAAIGAALFLALTVC